MAYSRSRGTLPSKVDPCVALCNPFNSLCLTKAYKNCFYEAYVRNQLLLLECDEDDPGFSSKLYEMADMLRRYIEDVPKPIQETIAFVKDIHRKIFFLYGIASRDVRDSRKFPNSQELHFLLVRYVELEYEVLYSPLNYSPAYNKQVERRVLTLLLTILQNSESWKLRDSLEDNADEICAMNTLHIMTHLRVEYKKQQDFVENIMFKLLRILNVADEVSELKNKNRTFQVNKLQQVPKLREIFEYLESRDYGLDDSNSSEDEIEEVVEQVPTPVKQEVAYEVEEKYDISSFACRDTQVKIMTIDLIDEDFSMVYFRPEVQKIDKQDKKSVFDSYNVQIPGRTISNISDRFDKYIRLNSVTTSTTCDNKPLNSRSGISNDSVVLVIDDDSDNDIEIVQDDSSSNLESDSVVSPEQQSPDLGKPKHIEFQQHLQPTCLELEDALLQCDDISDNEIENEDEILNKYNDDADDAVSVANVNDVVETTFPVSTAASDKPEVTNCNKKSTIKIEKTHKQDNGRKDQVICANLNRGEKKFQNSDLRETDNDKLSYNADEINSVPCIQSRVSKMATISEINHTVVKKINTLNENSSNIGTAPITATCNHGLHKTSNSDADKLAKKVTENCITDLEPVNPSAELTQMLKDDVKEKSPTSSLAEAQVFESSAQTVSVTTANSSFIVVTEESFISSSTAQKIKSNNVMQHQIPVMSYECTTTDDITFLHPTAKDTTEVVEQESTARVNEDEIPVKHKTSNEDDVLAARKFLADINSNTQSNIVQNEDIDVNNIEATNNSEYLLPPKSNQEQPEMLNNNDTQERVNVDKQASKDGSLPCPDAKSDINSKTAASPTVNYENQTSCDDIEEYVGEFSAAFADHDCSNSLDVLASVAAEQKKMENSIEMRRRGNKRRKGRKVAKSNRIAAKPEKQTRKSELLEPKNKEVAVVTRRVTRSSSAQLNYATDARGHSCIPSAFMNLESLVTPTPNRVYHLISETVIDNEESLDEPFTCLDGQFAEIVAKNPVFDEDTVEDGISLVCHKKQQSNNKEVVISIPDSEKDYPGINYDILEQFAETSVISGDTRLNCKVIAGNMSEDFYQSSQTETHSEVCKNKTWQEIAVEPSTQISECVVAECRMEEIVENNKAVMETSEGIEITISDPIMTSKNDSFTSSELLHNDRIETDAKIVSTVPSETENTIDTTDDTETFNDLEPIVKEVQISNAPFEKTTNGEIAIFSPKKTRRKAALNETAALLMPVKKRQNYGKKNIIINKYEKKGVEISNANVVGAKNIDVDAFKQQEDADQIKDASFSEKAEDGCQENLNEASSVTSEPEKGTTNALREPVTDKVEPTILACSDADANQNHLIEENCEISESENEISTSSKTDLEMLANNKETNQDLQSESETQHEVVNNSAQVEEEEINSCSIESAKVDSEAPKFTAEEVTQSETVDCAAEAPELAEAKSPTEAPEFHAEEIIHSCKTQSAAEIEGEINSYKTQSVTEEPEPTVEEEISFCKTRSATEELTVEEEINSCKTRSVTEEPEIPVEEENNSCTTKSVTEEPEPTVEEEISCCETRSATEELTVEEKVNSCNRKSATVDCIAEAPEFSSEEVINASKTSSVEVPELAVEEQINSGKTRTTTTVDSVIEAPEVTVEEEVNSSKTQAAMVGSVTEAPELEEQVNACITEASEVTVEEEEEEEINSCFKNFPEPPLEEVHSCVEGLPELTDEEEINSSVTEAPELTVEEEEINSCFKDSPEAPLEEFNSCITEAPEPTVQEVNSCFKEVPEFTGEEEINSCIKEAPEVAGEDLNSCFNNLPEPPLEEVHSCVEELPELTDEGEINSCTTEAPEVAEEEEEINSCFKDSSEPPLEEVHSCITEAPEPTVAEVNSCFDEVPEFTGEEEINSCTAQAPTVAVEEEEMNLCNKDSPELIVEEVNSHITGAPEFAVEEKINSCITEAPSEVTVEEEIINSYVKDSPELTLEEVNSCITEAPSEVIVAEEVINSYVKDSPELTLEEVNSCITEAPSEVTVEEEIINSYVKDSPELTLEEVNSCITEAPSEVIVAEEVINSYVKDSPELTLEEVNSCITETPELAFEEEINSCIPDFPEVTVEEEINFCSNKSATAVCITKAPELVVERETTATEIVPLVKDVDQSVQFHNNIEPQQLLINKDEQTVDHFCEPNINDISEQEIQACESKELEETIEVPSPQSEELVHETLVSTSQNELECAAEVPVESDKICVEDNHISQTPPVLEKVSESHEISVSDNRSSGRDNYEFENTQDTRTMPTLEREISFNQDKIVPRPTEDISNQKGEFPDDDYPLLAAYEIEAVTEEVVESCTADNEPHKLQISEEHINLETSEKLVDMPQEIEVVATSKEQTKVAAKMTEEPCSKIVTNSEVIPGNDHRDGNRRVLTKAALKAFQNPYVQLQKLPENYDYKRKLSELIENPKAAKIGEQRSKSQDNTLKRHKRDSRSLSESKHKKRHENLEASPKDESAKREKRVKHKERESHSRKSGADCSSEKEETFKTKTRSSSQKQRDKEAKPSTKTKTPRSLSESKIELKSKQNDITSERKTTQNKDKPKGPNELQLFSVEDSKITYHERRRKPEKETPKRDYEKKGDDTKSARKEEKSSQSITNKNEEITNNKSSKDGSSRSSSRNDRKSSKHAREKTEKEETGTQNKHGVSVATDDTNITKTESNYSIRRHSRRSISTSRPTNDKTKETILDLKEKSKKNESDKITSTDKVKPDKISDDFLPSQPTSDKNTELLADVKKSSDHKRHRSSRSSSKSDHKDSDDTGHEKKKPRVEKNKENACVSKSETESETRKHKKSDVIEKNSNNLESRDTENVEPKISKRDRRESLRSSSSRDKAKIKSSLKENGSLSETDLIVKAEACPRDLSEKPKLLKESKKLPKKRRSEDHTCELEAKSSKKSTYKKLILEDNHLETTDCKAKKPGTEIENKETKNEEVLIKQTEEHSKNTKNENLEKFNSTNNKGLDQKDEGATTAKSVDTSVDKKPIGTSRKKKEKEPKKSVADVKNLELLETDAKQIENLTQNEDSSKCQTAIDTNDEKTLVVDASSKENQTSVKIAEFETEDTEDVGSKMVTDANNPEPTLNNCLIDTSGEKNETVKEKSDSKENVNCETVNGTNESATDNSSSDHHEKSECGEQNQQEDMIDAKNKKSLISDNVADSIKNEDKFESLEHVNCDVAQNTETLEHENTPSEILEEKDKKSKSQEHNNHKLVINNNGAGSTIFAVNFSKRKEKLASKKKNPKRIDFIIENLKNRKSQKKNEVTEPAQAEVLDSVIETEESKNTVKYRDDTTKIFTSTPKKEDSVSSGEFTNEQAPLDCTIPPADNNEPMDHSGNVSASSEIINETETSKEINDFERVTNANVEFKNSELEMESDSCPVNKTTEELPPTVQEVVVEKDSAVIPSSVSEINDSVEEDRLVEKEDLNRAVANAKEPGIVITNDSTLHEILEVAELNKEHVDEPSLVATKSHQVEEPDNQSSAEKFEGFATSELTFPTQNSSSQETVESSLPNAPPLEPSPSESRMSADDDLTQTDVEEEEIDETSHLVDIRPHTPAETIDDDSLTEAPNPAFMEKSLSDDLLHFKDNKSVSCIIPMSATETMTSKNNTVHDHSVPSTSAHSANGFAGPGVSTSVPLLHENKEEVIVNLNTSNAETSTSCETTDYFIEVIFSKAALINDSEQNQPNKPGYILIPGTDHNYHSVGGPLMSGKCDNSESDHSSENSKEVPTPELESVLVDDNILPYIPTLIENNQELSSSLSESPVDGSSDFQLLEQCLIGPSPPLPQGCDNLYQTNLKQEVLDYDDTSTSSNIEFTKESSEVYINQFQQQTMSMENMSELMNAVLTGLQNLNNMTRPAQRCDSTSKDNNLFQPVVAEVNAVQTTNANSSTASRNPESDCNFVPMQEIPNSYAESSVEYSDISFSNEVTEPVSFETDFTNFYYLPVTHDASLNNASNKKVIVERIPQYTEQLKGFTEITNVPSVSTVPTSKRPATNANVKPKQVVRSSNNVPTEITKPSNLPADKVKPIDINSDPVPVPTASNVGFVRTSSRTPVSAPRPKKPSDRKSVDTSEESGPETFNKSSNKLKVRADLGISNNTAVDAGHKVVPAKERSLFIIEDSNGLGASKQSHNRLSLEECSAKVDARKSSKQPKETLTTEDLSKLNAKTQNKQPNPKEDVPPGADDSSKLNPRRPSSKPQKQPNGSAEKSPVAKNRTAEVRVKDAKSQTTDLIPAVQTKPVKHAETCPGDMMDNVKRRKRKPVDYIERVDYSSIDKLLGYELENGKLPPRTRQKKEETEDASPRPKKRKQEIIEDKQLKSKAACKPSPEPEKSKVDAGSACNIPDVVVKTPTSTFEDSDDDLPLKKKSKPETNPESRNDLFDRLFEEGSVNAKYGYGSKPGKDPTVNESFKRLDPPNASGARTISTNIFNLEQKKPDAVTPVKQIGVVNPIPRSSNVVRKEPPCNRNSYGGGEESRNSSQYYPERSRRSYPYSNRESNRSSHQGSSRRMEYQPHSSDQRYSSSQRSSNSGRSSRSSRHHSNSRSSTEQRNYNRYTSSAATDLAWREDMKKKFPNMFKDEVYF